MKRFRVRRTAGVLLLGFLAVWLAWLGAKQLAVVRSRGGIGRGIPAPPPGTSGAALDEARRQYLKAEVSVKQRLEALEEWDPDAIGGSTPDIYRKQFIARAEGMEQAHAAALQAVALARSERDRYLALTLLTRIECDLGQHQAELQHAQALAAAAPRDEGAWLWLRRAAHCNGQTRLERRAERVLREMGAAAPALDPRLDAGERLRPGAAVRRRAVD